MGTQYLRKSGEPSIFVGGIPRSGTRLLAQPLSTSLYLNPSATVGQGTNTLRVIFDGTFFGTGATLIPLSISLGSANRAITTSQVIALAIASTLGGPSRTVSLASVPSVAQSGTLGSANRTIVMDASIVTLLPLAFTLTGPNRTLTVILPSVRVPPSVSLGSANRALAISSSSSLTQSITFPHNSAFSLGILSQVLPGISLSTIGTISMSESIDTGGGSNPQVGASVSKITGCGMAIAVHLERSGSIDTTKQMGVDVRVIVPLSIILSKEGTLAEKPIPPEVPFTLGPLRNEEFDNQSPVEKLTNRGIPPAGSR